MPYNSNDDLPKGAKGLPEGQQTKWRKVFNAAYEGTCKERSDRDECASKIAWSQIEDKYKGKALVEFSLTLKSATHDKKAGTLRWKAVASDTDEDFYDDNMSLELFNDFVERINIKELAPEEFRSSFWQGGMPYPSISHYPDLEGKAVPGTIERVFVDGDELKSDGQFYKNKLGLTCYHAICKDLYEEPKPENPIRISIAFLDYGHVHKSNDYEFERKSIDDTCSECIKETNSGEISGRIFKKGQLVHLAFTRVPANDRTSVEVEKSMTTRKDDAVSIVGEELADEIEQEAKLVGKSQALIIKSDEEEENKTEEVAEVVSEPELVEEMEHGKDDEYECPDDMSEEDCKKKMKEHKKETKKSLTDEQLDRIEKMVSEIAPKSPEVAKSETILEHELDTVFAQFKSAYDEIKVQPITANEKLQLLQQPFGEIGNEIKSRMLTEPEVESVEQVNSNDLVQAFSLAMISAMKPVSDKLDLLLTQKSEMVKLPQATPVLRSIRPTLSMQQDINKAVQKQAPNKPVSKLTEQIRKSVGLEN